MKNRHIRFEEEIYDDEDDYTKRGKKKESPRRRETRNWKKAWSKHQDNYDELDDFYATRK